MILTDLDILERMRLGSIVIDPFDRFKLGSNSYDLSLSHLLLIYTELELDAARDNPYAIIEMPQDGYLLLPGQLYLGSTKEWTKSADTLPQLEGKSSIARLGISVHLTAGFGDIGFEGNWTLEITVVKPVRVYPGMPIAQIYYMLPHGAVQHPYVNKADAKYNKQGVTPVPSRMWKNFEQSPKYPGVTGKPFTIKLGG